MILLENRKVDIIFKDVTGTDYDDIISDKPIEYSGGNKANYTLREYYKFEKGLEGCIEYMTARDYMEICSKYVFDGRDSYRGIIYNNVDKYADAMRSGTKFYMPYIRYGYGQEGRHRMLAADKVYPNCEFPVLVIYNAEYTDEERIDYLKKKYGENNYKFFM